MPYVLFHDYFPEIAERETRTITVLPGADLDLGLPAGEYAFLEMFCDEKGCDCRRVFFSVLSSRSREFVAVVAYGWEPIDYYAKWMKSTDPLILDDVKGPVLNLASPQSQLAPEILDLVKNVLLQDAGYVERVKRHYRMFRDKIDGIKPAWPKRKSRRKRG